MTASAFQRCWCCLSLWKNTWHATRKVKKRHKVTQIYGTSKLVRSTDTVGSVRSGGHAHGWSIVAEVGMAGAGYCVLPFDVAPPNI